jgi:GT2 family glycosyltransferase
MRTADVVAVVATYRRAPELARLLASLRASSRGLRAIVVDNADDSDTRAVVAASPLTIDYLPQPRNLGCGGALAIGERFALDRFGATLTHVWILDDDAVVERDTLDRLLDALETQNADLAHPLVVDGSGGLGWFPGLLDRRKFQVVKKARTPQEFIDCCGAEPVPVSWAQGIALLVTRRAIDRVGLHRGDFLVRGEDLEFSLRITAHLTGVYVPQARVAHLPPASAGGQSHDGEYFKHRAMLQNIAYTALRLPHGHRIARTIPGNWWRFFTTWGWQWHVIRDAVFSLIRGALLGKPAGFGMH